MSSNEQKIYYTLVSVTKQSKEQLESISKDGWKILSCWQSGNDWHYTFERNQNHDNIHIPL